MDRSFFFKELYEEKPSDGLILLWQKENKTSYWAKDYKHAEEIVSKNNKDIYYGIGISPKDFGKNKRCLANDIIGMPCFGVDIDVYNETIHPNKMYPDSIEKAKNLVYGNGFDPTIVIDSGWGIQALWLFKEFWNFKDDAERKSAMVLSKRLFLTINKKAGKTQNYIDNTSDLSRVLRPPGTFNCKNGNAKNVSVLDYNDSNRYNPEDFEEFFVQWSDFGEKNNRITSIQGLEITSEPPSHKLSALLAYDEKFKATWEMKRTDLKDSSPSGYDLALASMAAHAEWSDCEIAKLLIAFRRMHGKNPEKILRKDYFDRIIVKVLKIRSEITSKKASEEIEISQVKKGTEYFENTEERKHKLLESISTKLGVVITGIEKYLVEPPNYCLITSSGRVTLGNVDQLISYSSLRKHIASKTGHIIPKFDGRKKGTEKWDNIAQAMLDVCTEIEMDESATDIGKVKIMLEEYLGYFSNFDIETGLETKSPFIKDGSTYFFLESLQKWSVTESFEIMANKAMVVILKQLGCTSEKFNFLLEGKRTTRRSWKIPQDIFA